MSEETTINEATADQTTDTAGVVEEVPVAAPTVEASPDPEDTSAADPLPVVADAPEAQTSAAGSEAPVEAIPDAAPTPSAESLLLRYLAQHGGWREVTVSNSDGVAQFQEFTRCACSLCADAAALVGEPSTPNG